jgi:uncharacterized Fe-S radical SAM superfamily protein PflX
MWVTEEKKYALLWMQQVVPKLSVTTYQSIERHITKECAVEA